MNNLIFKNYKGLTKSEHKILLEIRNTNYVRMHTKSLNIITLNEHLIWVNELKASNKNIYYAIQYENIIIGSISIINIDYENKSCFWGLYFKKNINPFISSISSYIIIDKVFEDMKFNILNLEVSKENIAAYNFDISFGFDVYDENDKYFYMLMSSKSWKNNKNKKILKIINNKIKSINYEFI